MPHSTARARRTAPQRCSQRVTAALLGFILLLPVARPCTVFELMSSGFAANAVHLMHAEAVFGGGLNGTFFVDSKDFSYKCSDGGGWHDFFDVPDVLVPWSEAREAAEGHVCRRHTFDTVDALLYDLSMGWDGVDAIGAMNLWRFQGWVREKVDAKLAALEQAAKPTIGFHIRGGDKGEEDVLRKRTSTEPADFIATFKRTWPGVRGGTCVLVGDDGKRIAEAERIAEREIGCTILRTSTYFREEGHVQYHFNVQPYTQRCLGTVDFLVDIEMLAHTDYAVLTFNSGLAHLVDTLRYALYGKERWSFVDASGTAQDYWHPVRGFFRRWNPHQRPNETRSARRMMRKGAEPLKRRKAKGPKRRKQPA